MTTYLADSGAVVAPDDEASGDDSVDFLAFFAFLCFFDFLAFGCVSVPDALLPASVPDWPELADGLLLLEPAAPVVPLVPLAPLAPLASLGDALDAPLPDVPDAPDVPLLMPDDEVPLAPDDGDDDGEDMAPEPVLSCELEEEEGMADLLPALESVPVDCASAMDDTEATSTNDKDWIVVFNVMSNSLDWKKASPMLELGCGSGKAVRRVRRGIRQNFREFFSCH